MKTPPSWPKLLTTVAALLLLNITPAVQAFTLADLLDKGPSEDGNGKYVKLIATLKDGFDATGSVVWSPDGRYIATSGYGTKAMHIWDIQQKKLAKEIQFTQNIGYDKFSIAWSPDGRYLASCHGDQNVSMRIHDTRDWHVAKEFFDEDFLCSMVRFTDDSREMAVIGGRSIETIDTSTWQVLKKVKIPQLDTDIEAPNWTDITYVPSTHILAIAGDRTEKRGGGDPCALVEMDGPKTSGRVWWLGPKDTDFSHSLSVNCSVPGVRNLAYLRFHPNGQQFATTVYLARGAFRAYVLSYPEGKLLQTVYPDKVDGTVGVVRYTPDGRFLLIGINRPPDRHGQLDIVDTATGQIVDSVRVAFHSNDIAVNAQSTAFAVATGDGIKVWSFLPR